jgi:hypothetical protein
MKTIEELSLKNMVLIERYLNDQMSEKEAKAFVKQLAKDKELQDDYELVKHLFPLEPAEIRKKVQQQPFLPLLEGVRYDRKMNVGNSLIRNGLMIVLAVLLMGITCAFVLTILG